MVKHLMTKLTELRPDDPVRIEVTEQLLRRLYQMGLIPTEKSLSLCDRLTASAFCRCDSTAACGRPRGRAPTRRRRRRLPVVMVRLKMSESVKEAVQLVEHGHVRVGPDTVLDPALLVTRAMEDFVTWTESSKIRRHVMQYTDTVRLRRGAGRRGRTHR